MSHGGTGSLANVTCLMSNAYVDPWDMLNNFCFHVYAQMSLFMGENDNAFFDMIFDMTLSCNVIGLLAIVIFQVASRREV